MIHQLGIEAVAHHARIVDLDQAIRDDIDALRIWREKVAQTFADQVSNQMEIVAAIKHDAAAQDAEFAKAIARKEHMLGEPAVQFREAAE